MGRLVQIFNEGRRHKLDTGSRSLPFHEESEIESNSDFLSLEFGCRHRNGQKSVGWDGWLAGLMIPNRVNLLI